MKNRWVVLFAGIIIQVILGGIYAWSIFSLELIENYGITKAQCSIIFGVCIAVFTLAMTLAGNILTKKGPRFTALIGAILFMIGYLVASKSGGQMPMLILGVGVLCGSGIGFGYVCPLTVGMQWFPNHKGLITGIAVAGFGGGAVALKEIATHCFKADMNVLVFFQWLGIVAGSILIISALLLSVPDKKEETQEKATEGNVAVKPCLKSMPFISSSVGIFVGTFSGLLVIGNLAPMAKASGISAEAGAQAISIFAIGNAIGRISWGFLFDKMNYKTIPASLALSVAVLAGLAFAKSSAMFLSVAALLGFCFGANFVIYASALTRVFGTDIFPKLYPICFLGYGIAGITGPYIGGYLADKTGVYTTAIYISIGLALFATIFTAATLKSFSKKSEAAA